MLSVKSQNLVSVGDKAGFAQTILIWKSSITVVALPSFPSRNLIWALFKTQCFTALANHRFKVYRMCSVGRPSLE